VVAPGVAPGVQRTVQVRGGVGHAPLVLTVTTGTGVSDARIADAALAAIRTRLALSHGSAARVQVMDDDRGRRRWELVMPVDTDDVAPAQTEPAFVMPRGPVARDFRGAQLRLALVAAALLGLSVARTSGDLRAAAAAASLEPSAASVLAFAAWRAVGIPLAALAAWIAAVRAPVGVDARRWRAPLVQVAALAAAIGLALAARLAEPWVLPDIVRAAAAVWPRRLELRALAVTVTFVAFAVLAHMEVLAVRRRAAVGAWRALRRRRREATARRRDAELRALNAELTPHFVGNALHAALSLVRTDVRAAERVLHALRTLAEHVTERVGLRELTLGEELADLEPFVAIERARLGGARVPLVLEVAVPASLRDCAVPHFVLQPLVENAVRHGLAPTARGGTIVIAARRQGDALVIEVHDDGVGPDAVRAVRGTGMDAGAGTRAIRARLAALYGAQARFELEARPEGGAVARVVLPARMARAAA
nr:histidine kinase [Gemmatimonadaceae bacterium]